MPDGDVVSSRIQHRWRSTHAGLKGDATAGELAPRALKALTDTFRVHHGIPGLADYAAIVAACHTGDLTPAQARVQARLVAQREAQTPYTMTVLNAVLACVADRYPGAAVLQPPGLTVAEAVCRTLVDVELLGKVRAQLVGQRFPDHAAFDRAAQALHDALTPGLARVAESLQRDPSARRLRATPPRRRAARPSMTDILNTSLL